MGFISVTSRKIDAVSFCRSKEWHARIDVVFENGATYSEWEKYYAWCLEVFETLRTKEYKKYIEKNKT